MLSKSIQNWYDPSIMATYHNKALGNFLRDMRHRLDPESLNLPSLRRRRTTGLRREEVAERAGIGVDWYIRLEQGRSVSPSATTIDALATALCLSQIEHDHLRALANNPAARPFEMETVPDSVRTFLYGLAEPAYITGQRWDVLLWNDAANRHLLDFAAIPKDERNILLFMFTKPAARDLFRGEWQTTARRMVAQFRKTYDLWAQDASFKALAATLLEQSPEFAALWHSHAIEASHATGKAIHHGRTSSTYTYAMLQFPDNPSLRLAIYSPL